VTNSTYIGEILRRTTPREVIETPVETEC
jgi:hypothetical protein